MGDEETIGGLAIGDGEIERFERRVNAQIKAIELGILDVANRNAGVNFDIYAGALAHLTAPNLFLNEYATEKAGELGFCLEAARLCGQYAERCIMLNRQFEVSCEAMGVQRAWEEQLNKQGGV
jgi:hypothetical protein